MEPPPRRAPPSLLQLHLDKSGKVSDKWTAYFPVYERLFAELRDKPVSMLEIGVQNGGSLEVWAAYFERAESIVGCDIDPRCQVLQYDDSRIRVAIADGTDAAVARQIVGAVPPLDILIDDGSHVSGDIVRTFLAFFESVKPGGLYIVEDTHTLFWEAYGGGVLREEGAHAFFKRLADLTNLEHWASDLKVETLFASFVAPSAFPAFLREGWVRSVEFSNSMIVVRKSDAPQGSSLGRRLVCGDDAFVDERPLAFRRPRGA